MSNAAGTACLAEGAAPLSCASASADPSSPETTSSSRKKRSTSTDIMAFSPASNFETHGLNYFITYWESAPPLRAGASSGYLNQAKFRVSVRYKVAGGTSEPDSESGLYFGYRQLSFWHLWDADRSRPFYDNSYRPGGFLRLSRFDASEADPRWQSLIPSLEVGFFHESNGRGGPTNRSLNQIEINGWLGMPGASRYAARASVYALTSRAIENADINDQIGRAEVGVFAAPGTAEDDKYGGATLFVTSRVWGETFFRNIEANLLLTPARKEGNISTVGRRVNLSLIFQLFHGYGENLLDYDQVHTSFRFGFAFLL
jgi:outer membrane phospholipase A